MKLHNTASRKLEEFKPLSSREVKIYSCGPTVYNYAHIWNLKTYTFEDIVVRTLSFLWYNVNYVMNITDVEDKTIKSSIEAGESLLDYTRRYTEYFLEDLDKLNIKRPNTIAPITELIPEMVRMINTMLKRKNAYLWDDWSIYFNISTSKNYWKFANLDSKNLKSWVRINNDEYDKESASDFVLWKAWKKEDQDNFWEEEFEIEWKKVVLKWRPWWHIECSACNMKYLGKQIDIHMWWVDLIFPHHQNEIAQTESCTNKPFTKYWLHSGHLMVNGKKMSKSLNNFYTIKDLEEKYEDIDKNILYRAIRLSFINAKYASEIDFTFEKLDSNIKVIKSIDETIKILKKEIEKNKNFNPVNRDFSDKLQDFINDYIERLEDDFNIPEALAVFHEFLKFSNNYLRSQEVLSWELKAILDMFKTFNEVLGIIDFSQEDKTNDIPEEITKKFEKRQKAKEEKDFQKADEIRDELLELWYKIIDSKDWSYIEKK